MNEVTAPYARDLILQAHDQVIAQRPEAAEYTLVEAPGSAGLGLDATNKSIIYDPAMPTDMSLDGLTDLLLFIFIKHWIETQVPLCSYFPLAEDSLCH